MAVIAIQQIRRMRGGAQSHLMLASDGNLYVVKFRNNPQHVRVLANELLATRLGAAIGLAVPHSEVIEVTRLADSEHPGADTSSCAEERSHARPGLHFASRWVGGLMPGQVVDYLPEQQLLEVRNLARVRRHPGAGQMDLQHQRQASGLSERPPGAPLPARPLSTRDTAFMPGTGSLSMPAWAACLPKTLSIAGSPAGQSFEPWLSRIENLAPETAWAIAEIIPPEWYGGDLSALEVLLERLLARRARVRELIVAFRESARRPFPNWGEEGEKRLREGLPERRVGAR